MCLRRQKVKDTLSRMPISRSPLLRELDSSVLAAPLRALPHTPHLRLRGVIDASRAAALPRTAGVPYRPNPSPAYGNEVR
jgi:hypothetical protein